MIGGWTGTAVQRRWFVIIVFLVSIPVNFPDDDALAKHARFVAKALKVRQAMAFEVKQSGEHGECKRILHKDGRVGISTWHECDADVLVVFWIRALDNLAAFDIDKAADGRSLAGEDNLHAGEVDNKPVLAAEHIILFCAG